MKYVNESVLSFIPPAALDDDEDDDDAAVVPLVAPLSLFVAPPV